MVVTVTVAVAVATISMSDIFRTILLPGREIGGQVVSDVAGRRARG